MQAFWDIIKHHEVWVILIPFFVLLFAGCKFMPKGKWNDDVMSIDHTKSFLGFIAIGIILHHCSQQASAFWLNPINIRPGLEFFPQAGYLLVSSFFFCSGYGLYKSSRNNPRSFDHFFSKRLIPLIIPSIITTLVLIPFYLYKHCEFPSINPFKADGPEFINIFIWFVPELILFYVLFYICFKVIRRESTGLLLMGLCLCLLILFCFWFDYKKCWYNACHLFLIGILFSKYDEKVRAFSKRFYIPLVITMPVLAVFCFLFSNYSELFIGDQAQSFAVYYACILASAFMSVYSAYLIGLKIHIGNPVLSFLGKQTLEIYLAQCLFVYMFGYTFIDEEAGPILYIKYVPLYVLVVIVTTLIYAFLLYLIDSKVRKALNKR